MDMNRSPAPSLESKDAAIYRVVSFFLQHEGLVKS